MENGDDSSLHSHEPGGSSSGYASSEGHTAQQQQQQQENAVKVSGNREVWWGKVATITTILATALTVSALTYRFLRQRDQLEFEDKVSSASRLFDVWTSR